MGTNYYAYTDMCPHCGRGDEGLHIGKDSYGWTFSWHALSEVMDGVEVKSCREWYEFLERDGVTIKSEYGDVISLDDFRKLVDGKRSEKHNQTKEYPDNYCWLDSDGCSFSSHEFS